MTIRPNPGSPFWHGLTWTMGAITATCIAGIIFCVSVSIIQTVEPPPFDDSDLPGARSGMSVRTDHLTGCQYLAAPLGGLTPRLEMDGRQVCKGEVSHG